jgi:hypothetical protein
MHFQALLLRSSASTRSSPGAPSAFKMGHAAVVGSPLPQRPIGQGRHTSEELSGRRVLTDGEKMVVRVQFIGAPHREGSRPTSIHARNHVTTVFSQELIHFYFKL